MEIILILVIIYLLCQKKERCNYDNSFLARLKRADEEVNPYYDDLP